MRPTSYDRCVSSCTTGAGASLSAVQRLESGRCRLRRERTSMLLDVAHVVAFLAGVFVVGTTVSSAIVTFVLPRAANTRISRFVFVVVRLLLARFGPVSSPYEQRDRVFAMQAPLSLLSLPVVWLVLVVLAFSAIFFA